MGYADPEVARQRAKAWRAANPEKARAADRRKYERNRDRMWEQRILRDFGLTAGGFKQMLAAQGEVCAICGQPETTTRNGVVKRLAVDHDHETGAVRGLLCARCNKALGLLAEDVARMEQMIEYVKEHDGSRTTVR